MGDSFDKGVGWRHHRGGAPIPLMPFLSSIFARFYLIKRAPQWERGQGMVLPFAIFKLWRFVWAPVT